jgi:ATP-dependent protease HslVU (ClpYQ) ATPase subunit
VEEISFDAPDRSGEAVRLSCYLLDLCLFVRNANGLLQIEIDDNYVRDRLSEVMSKTDLRKYIL